MEQERRYVDLKMMAEKYWSKNGGGAFDERKYWAYGCHCYLLGDRPMSEMGIGSPVDALDNRCKAYKDCQKCARAKHGNDCIGEMVKYTWRYSKKSESLAAREEPGTCARDLFECDRQLIFDVGRSGCVRSAMTALSVWLGSWVHFLCSLRQEPFGSDRRPWVKRMIR